METINVCLVDGENETEPVSLTAEQMESFLSNMYGGNDKSIKELKTEVKDNLSKYLTKLNDNNELYKKVKFNGKEYENIDGYDIKIKSGMYENGFNIVKINDIIKVKTYTIENGVVCINSMFNIKLNGKITYFMINYFRGGRVKRKNSAVNKEDYDYVIEYLNAVDISELLEKQKQ